MTDLKDVLHFYFGQKVVLLYGHLYRLLEIRQWLIRIESDELKYGNDRPMQHDVGLESCQIVLRSIGDMTEEEKYHIVTNITYSHIKFSTKQSAMESFDPDRYSQKHNNRFYPDEFIYLCKQGFDLFGLIDSNQAIDQKTLQP
jgi:hypothetical protein